MLLARGGADATPGASVPTTTPGSTVSESETEAVATTATAAAAEVASAPGSTAVVPMDVHSSVEGVALATGGTPAADFLGALPGDDARARLPLGVVADIPDSVRLDFLFEFCWGPCFRDAHFMDPAGSGLGSGPYPANTAFHVRHGFINESDEPLGDGFDVAIYVTPQDEPGEFGGRAIGQTYRYHSDYTIRGRTETCGPTYGSLSEPVTCEWFVHEFAEGLPAGRHALWAVWEAPCAAWVEYGFTESCEDDTEVMSFFSSGVDSPFDGSASYSEENDALLSEDERQARIEGHDDHGSDEEDDFAHAGAVADPSGAAPTGGTPLPDFALAVAGDHGSGPLPLGTVNVLPATVRADFLFEFCWGPCFRDGHFMAADNPRVGSGPFTSGEPFHVRHGFVNESSQPLGEGFDVVIYITPQDAPGELGGQSTGQTYRYTSDYVVQGSSDACGPTYRTQTSSVTCEWFVHEFAEGLPEGRHALWAVWEAPCAAWIDYGFVAECTDPNEVLGLFTSGFDSPFGPFPPNYTEVSEAP